MLVPSGSTYMFYNHNFSILTVYGLVTRYGTATKVLDELAKEVVPYNELDPEALTWFMFQETMDKRR